MSLNTLESERLTHHHYSIACTTGRKQKTLAVMPHLGSVEVLLECEYLVQGGKKKGNQERKLSARRR